MSKRKEQQAAAEHKMLSLFGDEPSANAPQNHSKGGTRGVTVLEQGQYPDLSLAAFAADRARRLETAGPCQGRAGCTGRGVQFIIWPVGPGQWSTRYVCDECAALSVDEIKAA